MRSICSRSNSAELDREQIERILEAQRQLEEGMGKYLEDQQLGLKREQQRLTLQLSDKILFASGSTTIKREGPFALDRCAA